MLTGVFLFCFLKNSIPEKFKVNKAKKSTNRFIFLLHVCDFCALLGRYVRSVVSVGLESPSWCILGDKQTHILLDISAMQQTAPYIIS